VTDDPATIPLTERGHAQAAMVARTLTEAPSLIVTSKYSRTQETAAPTIARFPDVPRAEWNVHEFTYLDRERCAWMKASKRKPLVDEYWDRSDPAHIDGEGAESFAMMMARVDELLERLRSGDNGAFVVVFTHGQLMRATMWSILSQPRVLNAWAMRNFRAYDLAHPTENAAIVRLLIDERDTVYMSGPSTLHLRES